MPSMEFDNDIEHQKLAWKIKRIGFGIIFLLVVLSSLGVFSQGILSSAYINAQNNRMEFHRFMRAGAPSDLIFTLTPASNSISLLISNNYMRNISIEMVSPQPVNEIAGDEFTEFTFNVSAIGQNLIKFSFTPEKPGYSKAIIKTGESEFSFNQIIYP
jgi:hypothetical protein